MAKNPIGPDGLPMERHHQGRQDGDTVLIPKTVHDIIHQNEIDAVRDVFKKMDLREIQDRGQAKPKNSTM